MSFFNNDFTGMNFGYSSSEENSFGGYPFGNEQSDAAIAGPSGSHDWYLNPSSEEYADQVGYQGSTLLGVWGNQLVDPYTLHEAHEPATGESHCFLS